MTSRTTPQPTGPTGGGRQPGETTLLRRLLQSKLSLLGLLGVMFFLGIAVFGPLLTPHDPSALGGPSLQPPDATHWMGTDNFGRDVFSRFLSGSRVSIFVGISSVGMGLILGTLFGMIAGWKSSTPWDGIIMRGMDVILAFPLLVMVPVITGVFEARGFSLGPISIGPVPLVAAAIGIVLTPLFARIARSSVLAEMREDYVLAARSFGARRRDILISNLLPNIMAPLVVQAAFTLATAITIEAAVSFLGLGVQPPAASWGTMLSDGRQYITLGGWWLVAFPSVAIALAVLSFNLLGDEFRDQLDPRAKTSAPATDSPTSGEAAT